MRNSSLGRWMCFFLNLCLSLFIFKIIWRLVLSYVISAIFNCRGCTSQAFEDGCAVKEEYLGYKQEICYCTNEDNCNGSIQLTGSALLAIALPFVMKIFA